MPTPRADIPYVDENQPANADPINAAIDAIDDAFTLTSELTGHTADADAHHDEVHGPSVHTNRAVRRPLTLVAHNGTAIFAPGANGSGIGLSDGELEGVAYSCPMPADYVSGLKFVVAWDGSTFADANNKVMLRADMQEAIDGGPHTSRLSSQGQQTVNATHTDIVVTEYSPTGMSLADPDDTVWMFQIRRNGTDNTNDTYTGQMRVRGAWIEYTGDGSG